jgi:hypothetical protein
MQRPTELRVGQKGLNPFKHDKKHRYERTEAVGVVENKILVALTRPECDLIIE